MPHHTPELGVGNVKCGAWHGREKNLVARDLCIVPDDVKENEMTMRQNRFSSPFIIEWDNLETWSLFSESCNIKTVLYSLHAFMPFPRSPCRF